VRQNRRKFKATQLSRSESTNIEHSRCDLSTDLIAFYLHELNTVAICSSINVAREADDCCQLVKTARFRAMAVHSKWSFSSVFEIRLLHHLVTLHARPIVLVASVCLFVTRLRPNGYSWRDEIFSIHRQRATCRSTGSANIRPKNWHHDAAKLKLFTATL